MQRLTLNQILEESDSDLKLNATDLMMDSIKNPSLFSKYNKLLSLESITLRTYELDLSTKKKEAWEYYSGKADPEIYKVKPFGHRILKGQMDFYINNDPEVLELDKKIIIQQEKVDTLLRILKEVNNRQWNIRNAQDWLKFQAGING